ncbi:MAG: capsule biosynthesis protein [Sphingobium sp.]|nr:capsule biosynthesis protein [Sphingobium sp.]
MPTNPASIDDLPGSASSLRHAAYRADDQPEPAPAPHIDFTQLKVPRVAPNGWVEPEDDDDFEAPKSNARLLLLALLLIVLPTLLAAGFEYLVAADRYESEAKFIVRAPQMTPSSTSLGQMLGLANGTTPADAHSVGEYLLSHDAVDALGQKTLTGIFRRPEADFATRLWFAEPKPETLLKYYRDMVRVTSSTETGITTLSVQTFRPTDSKVLADQLLRLGEERVNSLNQRMLNDGLAAADRQVRDAEMEVERTAAALTRFRQSHRDIDPERSGAAQIQLASSLEQAAATARANFEAMAAKIPPSAPQYAAAARQVHALEAQVSAARARMAGSSQSLAAGLGEYEELRIKQDFAAKRYQAAATSYQGAREQLLKQQLFIVSVVKPNLPGKALFPKRLLTVATVFFGLLLTFSVGWLVFAGVREHAA